MLLRKKEEIEVWLNQYNIINYELIEDKKYGYVVNVNGNVDLYNRNLKRIDIKFNEIKGNFNCSSNKLTSLEGCPEVVTCIFDCRHNQLKSLEYSPKTIEYYFYSSYNKLSIEGLKHLPKKVNENYINISENKDLGELQNIRNFNELKEKVKIFVEKENLLNIINEKKLNKHKIVNKI